MRRRRRRYALAHFRVTAGVTLVVDGKASRASLLAPPFSPLAVPSFIDVLAARRRQPFRQSLFVL